MYLYSRSFQKAVEERHRCSRKRNLEELNDEKGRYMQNKYELDFTIHGPKEPVMEWNGEYQILTNHWKVDYTFKGHCGSVNGIFTARVRENLSRRRFEKKHLELLSADVFNAILNDINEKGLIPAEEQSEVLEYVEQLELKTARKNVAELTRHDSVKPQLSRMEIEAMRLLSYLESPGLYAEKPDLPGLTQYNARKIMRLAKSAASKLGYQTDESDVKFWKGLLNELPEAKPVEEPVLPAANVSKPTREKRINAVHEFLLSIGADIEAADIPESWSRISLGRLEQNYETAVGMGCDEKFLRNKWPYLGMPRDLFRKRIIAEAPLEKIRPINGLVEEAAAKKIPPEIIEAVRRKGIDPEIVAMIISKNRRFRGEAYMPWQYFRRDAGLQERGSEFDAAFEVLVKSGAILMKKEGETASINPHTNEIKDPELREYISRLLYDSLRES